MDSQETNLEDIVADSEGDEVLPQLRLETPMSSINDALSVPEQTHPLQIATQGLLLDLSAFQGPCSIADRAKTRQRKKNTTPRDSKGSASTDRRIQQALEHDIIEISSEDDISLFPKSKKSKRKVPPKKSRRTQRKTSPVQYEHLPTPDPLMHQELESSPLPLPTICDDQETYQLPSTTGDRPRTPEILAANLFPSLVSRYSIAPKVKSTPMAELIRRVNSLPGSPFSTSASRTVSSIPPRRPSATAYSPYLKSSRSLLSKIAPLHPNRRTPPPPLPPPPPKKKTKKELEMEERWEEELVESVGGTTEWACMTDEERKAMRKAKKDMEFSGWDD